MPRESITRYQRAARTKAIPTGFKLGSQDDAPAIVITHDDGTITTFATWNHRTSTIDCSCPWPFTPNLISPAALAIALIAGQEIRGHG